MTTDGYFIQTLGRPMGYGQMFRYKTYHRGFVIPNDTSFQDEVFYGSMGLSENKYIYLVLGKQNSCLMELTGFETIKRQQFGTLTISASQVESLKKVKRAKPVKKDPRKHHQSRLMEQVGKLDGIPDQNLIAKADMKSTWKRLIQKVEVYIYVTPEYLVAVYKANPAIMENSWNNIETIFQGGGGVDIMLGTDPEADPLRTQPVKGDQRLLVVKNKGKIKAILYRPIVPGTSPEKRILYQSPVRNVYFDSVEEVTGDLKYAEDSKGFEFAIPLKTLGLKLIPGKKYLIDMGYMKGNGTETIQRVYWSNKDTGIVSDLPSEAKLVPCNWAVWSIN